ncbi:MAG: TIGR00366 family protein [Cytophagales bacterium]|nr:TIGR00366 family protein [Cytophagales bacterium]MDW8383583.1 TIGR00366 family protein [Flammeovirgaceae bacterium]
MKKIPDTLVIAFSILVVFMILTWVIPAGEYQRVEKDGRMIVVPGSYQPTQQVPQNLGAVLLAPIRGFVSASEIIGFVLLIGGAFGIINATGAITASLQSIIQASANKPYLKKVIIPLVMFVFSLAGATFGMSEENLVFILITVPLAISLGYDSIVGVAIPFIATGAGFAGAFSNPFTIGIAQKIADVPIFSGWEYRLIVWFLMTVAAIIWVMAYANRVEKNPQYSMMYEIDRTVGWTESAHSAQLEFTFRRKLVLAIFFIGLILLIVGVSIWDWHINEIAALFLGMGIASAIAYRIKLDKMIDAFIHGAKDMVHASLVIALSKGILLIATDGKIIDTILYGVAGLMDGLPKFVTVEMMFFVQSFLNFFVPSGSGQAALTMPIMAPLSDLLGITRQTAVLAFQFGDGLSNMFIPTSGVTMGILAIAKIPYDIWIKWIWKLMLVFFLIAFLCLIPPVTMFEWT